MNVHSVEQAEPSAGARPRERPTRRLDSEWLLDGRGFGWLRLGVDLAMLSLAVTAAIVGAHAAKVSVDSEAVLYAYPPLVVAALYVRGLYRRELGISILDRLLSAMGATSISAMAILAAVVFVEPASRPTGLIVRAWLFATVYVGVGRILLAGIQRRAREHGMLGRRALIVGAGRVGAHVARRLADHPEYGLRPIGFLDADPLPDQLHHREGAVLGGPDELDRVVSEARVDHVILAFSQEPDQALIPLVRRCDELGVEISLVPRLYEAINARVNVEHLGGMPLLTLRSVDPQGWQFEIKHVFDTVMAVVLLAALAPLMGVVALAVRLSSSGPIFFRQRRVGRDGRVFDLLKFRSMAAAAESDGDFRPAGGTAPGGVEGVDRRTAVGRLIRRTSIDELPQLVNVIRGEMSLVGPRPERPEFVTIFRGDIDRYGERHRVRSGITGWAQVHGYRGQTSLADRVEWDNFYIENWSLWLDFKILLLTVAAVLRPASED